MHQTWIHCAAVLLLATSPWAVAQTTLSPQTAAAIAAQAAPPEQPTLTVRQGSGGASFISGGAGTEERNAMQARRGQFPLKVVLSIGNGDYVVAERLRLLPRAGKGTGEPMLDVAEVGPWVMIHAPTGRFTLEVSHQGRTQRRSVNLGKSPTQVDIRFPG